MLPCQTVFQSGYIILDLYQLCVRVQFVFTILPTLDIVRVSNLDTVILTQQYLMVFFSFYFPLLYTRGVEHFFMCLFEIQYSLTLCLLKCWVIFQVLLSSFLFDFECSLFNLNTILYYIYALQSFFPVNDRKESNIEILYKYILYIYIYKIKYRNTSTNFLSGSSPSKLQFFK